MSNRAFVRQVADVQGTGPKLYRDAIMDAGFVGHFDFKSDYCRNGTTAAGAGKTFKNLVEGGADATVTTAFVSGLGEKGLISSNGAGALQLPNAWKLGTDETHFAFAIWAGWDLALGALPTSAVQSLGGYAYQTGVSMQYAWTLIISGGVLTGVRFFADGAFVELPAPARAAFTDGELHQLVGEFEVITGGTQRRLRVYFDGVMVSQAIAAFDGALNDPSGDPRAKGPLLGSLGGFDTAILRGHFGRTWLKRFGVDADELPPADLVALEWERYQDRFTVE